MVLSDSGFFTTAPLNSYRVFETNELVPSGATTRFASDSSIVVTRTNSTTLSIGNGSSAAQPQYVRFNPKSRAITSAITLVITAGTAAGNVDIWAYMTTAGALSFYVVDTSGNTFTIGTGTVNTAPNIAIPNGAVLIYSWIINSSGNFPVAGAGVSTDQQLSTDCWVDAVEISNLTGSAATITITDGQGTPIQLFDATSVGANGVVSYIHQGGRFFEGGIWLQSGTASALQCNVRGARLRRSPGIAGLNP